MSEKANDILKMDLYGLLDIEITATTKEIKKAYRQKALTCHPDKNPDNPQAVELFHQLSQALEVLTDAAARANYDKLCAAKKQAEERNRKLDAKRRKMKLDLEAREQAEDESERDAKIARTQEEEVARLREEGLRLLEEEQQRMREKVQRQTQCSRSSVTPKLKLKWKCKKGDETNGGYSQNVLSHILQKWGEVLNVIVSSKKKGSAVVEFATVRAAESAIKYEIGLRDNPLKISWIEGQPEVIAPSQPSGSMSTQGSVINERDYESLVLMKMRQAAERQKLIEQMQKEDEDES